MGYAFLLSPVLIPLFYLRFRNQYYRFIWGIAANGWYKNSGCLSCPFPLNYQKVKMGLKSF